MQPLPDPSSMDDGVIEGISHIVFTVPGMAGLILIRSCHELAANSRWSSIFIPFIAFTVNIFTFLLSLFTSRREFEMSHKDMIALKLQMGIDPAVKIEPNILLAMWQQLQIEYANAQRKRSSTMSRSNSMTDIPMVV